MYNVKDRNDYQKTLRELWAQDFFAWLNALATLTPEHPMDIVL